MTIAPHTIDFVIETLNNQGLIGLPTETVYGLAGDARSPEAVAKIYALKNRPSFNPLIAHVDGLKMAETLVELNETALKLIDAFWPGPLTLVLPVKNNIKVCDLARAGLDTQAIRCPAHPIARDVISKFGSPLVAPSANKSGRLSPTRAEHVTSEFGDDLSVVLDGGDAVLGLESTVLALLDNAPTLLRAGSLERSKIEATIGKLNDARHDDTAPRSPGMLSRHYAPNARLRLDVTSPQPNEAWLGFGADQSAATLNLSMSGDLTEAASNLYRMLRELDRHHDFIAVAPIPNHGLGDAINDRLSRASLS